MKKITLAIESSSTPTSVCLLNGKVVLEQYIIESQKQTSAMLSYHINNLIKSHLNSANDIDQIAVSMGPGSFTGLRAGVAAAKGITFAIKKPLIPVDTLFAIFHAYKTQYNTSFDYYIPMIDARKNRAYAAVYNSNGKQTMKNKQINVEKKFFKNWQNSLVVLPLNFKNNNFIDHLSLSCQVINLDSTHIGMAASESNGFFDEHKVAYLEPHYIVNNYRL